MSAIHVLLCKSTVLLRRVSRHSARSNLLRNHRLPENKPVSNLHLTKTSNPLPEGTRLSRKVRAFASRRVVSTSLGCPPGIAPSPPGLWSFGPRLFPPAEMMIPAYCAAACRRTSPPSSATPSACIVLEAEGALAAKSFNVLARVAPPPSQMSKARTASKTLHAVSCTTAHRRVPQPPRGVAVGC